MPSGLPHFGVPAVPWRDLSCRSWNAASIALVILAQSAATSRAYAAKYNDRFDENIDLVGLSVANLAADLRARSWSTAARRRRRWSTRAESQEVAQLTTAASSRSCCCS